MTMRALIVDDEPLARRRLRTLLRAETDIHVAGEAADGEAAVRAIEALRPDLVFLDVQMPGIDGFGVIDALGPGACPAVIFVTAHDTYALRAFDAHAVDYLLKPFDRSRLHRAIDRARTLATDAGLQQRVADLVTRAVSRQPLHRLVIRSAGRIHFVRADEIDWIDAAGHYVSVHAGRDTHLLRDTINRLASRLDPARFARIHRGTLVNLDRVKELQPVSHGEFDVVLKDGVRLKASRTFAAALTR